MCYLKFKNNWLFHSKLGSLKWYAHVYRTFCPALKRWNKFFFFLIHVKNVLYIFKRFSNKTRGRDNILPPDISRRSWDPCVWSDGIFAENCSVHRTTCITDAQRACVRNIISKYGREKTLVRSVSCVRVSRRAFKYTTFTKSQCAGRRCCCRLNRGRWNTAKAISGETMSRCVYLKWRAYTGGAAPRQTLYWLYNHDAAGEFRIAFRTTRSGVTEGGGELYPPKFLKIEFDEQKKSKNRLFTFYVNLPADILFWLRHRRRVILMAISRCAAWSWDNITRVAVAGRGLLVVSKPHANSRHVLMYGRRRRRRSRRRHTSEARAHRIGTAENAWSVPT